MTNRIGPYCLTHFGDIKDRLIRLQPAWLVLHDGEVKMEHVSWLREHCPQTNVILRIYESDSWFNDSIRANPEGTAENIHNRMANHECYGRGCWWITSNEVCQDWSGLPSLNRYHLRLQELSEDKLVLFSFSVENPPWTDGDPDGWQGSLMKHWQHVYPSMRRGLERQDVLGVHQYNAARITTDDSASDDRRIFRYEQLVWPHLPADLQALPVVITEFGWDFLLWPHNRKGGVLDPEAAISVDDAGGQLAYFFDEWNAAYLGRVPVLGWVFYSSGDSGSWHDYRMNVTGGNLDRPLLDHIIDHNIGGDWDPVAPPVDPDPPDPEPEPDPPEEELPMFERRISPALQDLNMTLEAVDISGLADTDIVWVLKDAWTTYNGSWEDNGHVWACPGWAKADYLLPGGHECYFDDAGGDHHIFGALLPDDFESGNVGCALLKDAGLTFWTDPNDLIPVNTKGHSGWGHVVMYSSSAYFPDQGEQGPWRWCRGGSGFGKSDVLVGAGMPYQHHVSFFGVWQKMTVARYKEDVLGDNPVDPPVDPPPADGEITEYLSAILNQIVRLADHLGA